MRKFRLLSLLFLSLNFIIVSCTKEGPEGPAGATGAQGPAGATGATGAQGPVGPGATYSAWFVSGDNWLEATASDPFYGEVFYYLKAAPSVTQTIIDQGVVLCYMKGDPLLDPPANTTPFQMPYFVGNGFGFLDQYDYTLTAGNIRFLYKSDFPWAAEDLAVVSFRYITIPGTVAGRGLSTTYGGYTVDELKAMPYEKVASLFNIPAEGTNIK